MIKFPKKILVDLETHLSEEKQRVLSQIADLNSQDPFNDIDRLTDNAASDTEAKEEFNHERYQAMLSELQLKKEALEEALLQIKKGTYGNCISCGEMIDTDRLAAIPTTRYCMKCQSMKKNINF